jgi:hypothetical protein
MMVTDPESKSRESGYVVRINRLQVAGNRSKESEIRKKSSGICTRVRRLGTDKEMVKRVMCSFGVLSCCIDNPSQRAVEIKSGVVRRSWTSGDELTRGDGCVKEKKVVTRGGRR